MVTPVITRAMTEITELRRTYPTPNPSPDDAGLCTWIPLADIATVLGHFEARLLTQMVLTRLAELNPYHYESCTFTDLKTSLDLYGIAPVKSHGVMVIAADNITQALTYRHQNTDS